VVSSSSSPLPWLHTFLSGDVRTPLFRKSAQSTCFRTTKMETNRIMTSHTTTRQNPSLFPPRLSERRPRLLPHTSVRCQCLRQIPDVRKHLTPLRRRPPARAQYPLSYALSILYSTMTLVRARMGRATMSPRRSNSHRHIRISGKCHVPRLLLPQQQPIRHDL
jgi:hypothetical protein